MTNKGYREAFLESHISNTIAAQIYHMREDRNWTQGDLAAKAGMLQPAVSRLERSVGSTSLSTLRKIAAACDVGLVVRFVPHSQLVKDAATGYLDRKIVSFEFDHTPIATVTPINSYVSTADYFGTTHLEGSKSSYDLTSYAVPAEGKIIYATN